LKAIAAGEAALFGLGTGIIETERGAMRRAVLRAAMVDGASLVHPTEHPSTERPST
jgi:hypothetical protein